MLSLGDSELLLHIAELSVTIAGFAGIASVLRDHADRSDIKVDAGRLTNMLIASLSTAMLALFPFIPDSFKVPDEAVWRSSGLVGLTLASAILFFRGIVSLLRPHAPD